MNPSISKLQFYSIGIVAANKKLSSDRIEVVPMEGSPLMSGELTDNIEQYQGGSQSPEGENFKVDMQTTASIEARWLPMNDTNRITSPDVRRGEMVAIYQFSDADEYWWMTLKQDKKLRRLETVIFSFSNVRKENEEVTAKNSYWMEVSTHGKYIHIHTSKNDEEPFEYDIQLNSKDERRGQMIAAANFFSFTGVFIASLLLYIFSQFLALSSANGFAAVATLTFLVFLILISRLSEFFFSLLFLVRLLHNHVPFP